MIPRGPLSPNMRHGGEGVAETPIVSKGLNMLVVYTVMGLGKQDGAECGVQEGGNG